MGREAFQPFRCFRPFAGVGAGCGGGGAGTRLAFDALGMDPATGEMLGVKQGVGVLTEGCATSKWLDDYEGVYREFLANEPGWSGGRVVRNQIKQSNNFTDVAWVKLEQGTGTVDPLEAGYEVCPTGLSSTRFKAHLNGGTTQADRARVIGYLVNSPGVAGKNYGGSIWVKSNTGANQNILFTSGSATAQQIVQEVTPTWQRLSFPTFGAGTTEAYVMVALYGDQTDQDCDILISSSQLEFIDDGESTFVPGEYSDNPNSDITTARVFGTTNGNTVTDNIVTEARGADLPEAPYVVHAPQATNAINESYLDATDDWLGGDKFTIVDAGPSPIFPFQHAFRHTCLGASGNGRVQSTGIPYVSGESVTLAFAVENVDASYTSLGLHGTPGFLKLPTYTWSTGQFDVPNCEAIDLGDGVTLLLIEAVVTAEFDAIDSTAYIYPAGSTANTDTAIIHYACMFHGKTIDQVRGSFVIPTEGASASRDACNLSFDGANHDNDNGAYYMEVDLDVQVVADAVHFLNPIIYKSENQSKIWSYDGAQVVQSGTINTSTLEKIGNAYGDGQKTIIADGVWGTENAYSGGFALTVPSKIALCLATNVTVKMRSLQRYSGAYEDLKTKIAELMA